MEIWSKEFAGRPECLVDARKFTYAVLDGCDAAHTVALVADELAGNAIKHTASGGPGGEFVLRLARFGNRCRVRVDDQGGPSTPAVYVADDADEAGRGLTIVSALSANWGVDGDENARSVWADITFDETPAIPKPGGPSAGLPSQMSAKRKVGMTTDDRKR
ncbi:ATP-binding protein [Catenulispora sp. NF23]|uniref:ATP-binding protein n=1 Tax=Catenulispora pinistramenti TaxID=2705254 RepID=UPI001BA67AE9|nr:ATP-binding protein [Catenulispora pinistramenti]MBS2531259.1 ATP-binding protein [Catenulispora pinistramenti]